VSINEIFTKKTLGGLFVFYLLVTIPLFLLASIEGAKNNNTTFVKHIIELWWVFLAVPIGLFAFHVCVLTLSTLVKK
jgi:hypothetical protein